MFDRNLMKLDQFGAIMALLVMLALLQAAAIAGQALMLSHVVSQLWAHVALSEVIAQLLAFFACFTVFQLLRFAQETMLDRYALEQACGLRNRLLDATFDARTLLARRRGAAIVATTLAEGVDEVETYIRIMPPKIVGMAAVSLPLLAITFVLDWVSGIILAVMFPVIVFFMVLLGRQSAARAERQYGAYTRLSNRFMDTLRGLDAIVAHGAGEIEGRKVSSYSERLRQATVRTLSTATLSSAVLDLCATFGVAAVAMMLAFRLMDGTIGLECALAVLILAPEYFSPIRSFASDFHASLDGKTALAGILEMLALAETASERETQEQDLPPWTQDSTLELDAVVMRHGATASIGPISFAARGFERIAIVGRSGAGKSTLADCLAGFRSISEGAAVLDGKPVDLSCNGWKRQVRYIPQSPYIFNATLLDNLRFYAPDAPLDKVREAVEAVGLQPLVEELPQGLETLLGKGARGLSGGQAHRVALARIMLDTEARVLVFDEPTAHLDLETELELKPYMLKTMEGKLVFFATHRLHWCDDLDRVLDLDEIAIANAPAFAQEVADHA